MSISQTVTGGAPRYKRLERDEVGPELNLAVVSCRSVVRYLQIEAVTSTSSPLQKLSFGDLIVTYQSCLPHDPR